MPILGTVVVTPSAREVGHFLYLSVFGWHDCTSKEDALIRDSLTLPT